MTATFQHPLMGARLSHLLATFARNGFVRPRYWHLGASMLGFASVRAPLGLLEQAILRARARAAPPLEAPVFIIGHWRSGTTHLHNLLGKNPSFGHISPLASGLPDELLTVGTWFRPLLERALPEDRHVDRVAVTPDSPQEDEIPLANLQPLSVFHALYFPRRFHEYVRRGVFFEGVREEEIEAWKRRLLAFLTKVALHQNRSLILVKNPVYTARIRRLREIWPDARFVHIRRDPFVVFKSTVHYYRKMLEELALQPYGHVDVEAFVLETYVKLMTAGEEQSVEVPDPQWAEVRFEDLEADPMGTVRDLHERLQLDGWMETEPRLRAYLDSIAGYRKNRFDISARDESLVRAHWGRWIEDGR
jgi:hypothetical protein